MRYIAALILILMIAFGFVLDAVPMGSNVFNMTRSWYKGEEPRAYLISCAWVYDDSGEAIGTKCLERPSVFLQPGVIFSEKLLGLPAKNWNGDRWDWSE